MKRKLKELRRKNKEPNDATEELKPASRNNKQTISTEN